MKNVTSKINGEIDEYVWDVIFDMSRHAIWVRVDSILGVPVYEHIGELIINQISAELSHEITTNR